MSTIVRLTPDAAEHNHNPAMSHLNGLAIRIGKPVKPNAENEKCGTDLVWPVDWVESLGTIDPVRYVCRHQIIAGD